MLYIASRKSRRWSWRVRRFPSNISRSKTNPRRASWYFSTLRCIRTCLSCVINTRGRTRLFRCSTPHPKKLKGCWNTSLSVSTIVDTTTIFFMPDSWVILTKSYSSFQSVSSTIVTATVCSSRHTDCHMLIFTTSPARSNHLRNLSSTLGSNIWKWKSLGIRKSV